MVHTFTYSESPNQPGKRVGRDYYPHFYGEKNKTGTTEITVVFRWKCFCLQISWVPLYTGSHSPWIYWIFTLCQTQTSVLGTWAAGFPCKCHSLVGDTSTETKNHGPVYVVSKGAMKRVLAEHRRRDHLCQGGLRKGKGGSRGWGGFSGRENACVSVWLHARDQDCVSRSDYMWVWACTYLHRLTHILICVHAGCKRGLWRRECKRGCVWTHTYHSRVQPALVCLPISPSSPTTPG